MDFSMVYKFYSKYFLDMINSEVHRQVTSCYTEWYLYCDLGTIDLCIYNKWILHLVRYRKLQGTHFENTYTHDWRAVLFCYFSLCQMINMWNHRIFHHKNDDVCLLTHSLPLIHITQFTYTTAPCDIVLGQKGWSQHESCASGCKTLFLAWRQNIQTCSYHVLNIFTFVYTVNMWRILAKAKRNCIRNEAIRRPETLKFVWKCHSA